MARSSFTTRSQVLKTFFAAALPGASQWDHPCDEGLRQLYLHERAKRKEKQPEAEVKCEEAETKALQPLRPQKPPPAKSRPPRPKQERLLEDAFCKSPSPVRAPESSKSPLSPPTPGLSAILEAEIKRDDISLWSHLEEGEETRREAEGSLEISSLTAALEHSKGEEARTQKSPPSRDSEGHRSPERHSQESTTRASEEKTPQTVLELEPERCLKEITNEMDAKSTPRACSAVDVATLQRLQWELKEEREDRLVLDRRLADSLTAQNVEQAAHSSTKAALRDSQREVQRLQGELRFKDSEVQRLEAELQKCQADVALLHAQQALKTQAGTGWGS